VIIWHCSYQSPYSVRSPGHWQSSQSSPFLETVIFPSCLPYLFSHSFCSIVLLSFPCFIFFFKMSCYKAYAVSDWWSNVKESLIGPFHLSLQPPLLDLSSPNLLLLARNYSFVESLRTNSFSSCGLHFNQWDCYTLTLGYDQWIANKNPQVVYII